MFIQQGILDNSFGVSGERILTNSLSSIGKLFKYQSYLYTIFSKNKDIIIYNIDLSQNEKIYNHSSEIRINDVFVDSSSSYLYFCGSDVSSNIGVYGLYGFNSSLELTISPVEDVMECNHIYIQNGNICIICTYANYQISVKQISSVTNRFDIYNNDTYAIVKGYCNVSNVQYIFIEIFNVIHNVYQTKIFNITNLTSVTEVSSYEDLSKNIFYQKCLMINNDPTVVYLSQDTISTQSSSNTLSLSSNTVYFYSLTTLSVKNSFTIPNYFIDCLTAIENQNTTSLIGYAYNSLGTELNYLSILVDASCNLDLSMEGRGYHVENPITSDYLIPRNKVECVKNNSDIYIITDVQASNQSYTKVMLTKLIYPALSDVFTTLQANDIIRILDEYGIEREVVVFKSDLNGNVSIPSPSATNINYNDISSNMVILFAADSVPNTAIMSGMTNIMSYYIKYFDLILYNICTLNFLILKYKLK